MYVYAIVQDRVVHYVGQTCQALNLRFNWHVWKIKHLGNASALTFHSWAATQDLSTLCIIPLAETDDPVELAILEGRYMDEFTALGHPVKSNKSNARPRRGHSLSTEHRQALSNGRAKSRRRRAKEGTGYEAPHHKWRFRARHTPEQLQAYRDALAHGPTVGRYINHAPSWCTTAKLYGVHGARLADFAAGKNLDWLEE